MASTMLETAPPARSQHAGGRLLTPAQRVGLSIVLAGVAVNAVICGGISAPTDRYNGRVIWLLPYCAAVLSLGAVRRINARADQRETQP
jgi:hypothetical protein